MKRIVFGMVLGVCIVSGGAGVLAQNSSHGDIIYGWNLTADGIEIDAPTGGCTTKDSFSTSTSVTSGGEVEIVFHRKDDDNCKGNFPGGVNLLFTWNDIRIPAGSKVKVENPASLARCPFCGSGELVKKTDPRF